MDTFALILSIIGSINWGLVGIFKFDLVAWIFGGQTSGVSRIIYTIVGLAGIWCISFLFRKRALATAEDILYWFLLPEAARRKAAMRITAA